MKLLVTGPLKGASGYSHVSRNVVKSLLHSGGDIVTRDIIYDNYEYQPTSEELGLFHKPLKDINGILQFTTPNEMRYKPGIFNSCYFFWETTRIPPYWVQQLNQMDIVFVPCMANAMAIRNSGLNKPILVVHPPFDLAIYEKQYEKINIPNSENRVLFYNINQLSAKKGIDALLKAYFTSFFDVPKDVMLVLKLYISMTNRGNDLAIIKKFIQQVKDSLRLPFKELPPVYIIPDFMTDDQIQGLHQTGHVYVNSSRAEGFSVGTFESMAHGNLVVSNQFGGMQEYVFENNALLYNGMLSPVCDMPHPDPHLYTGLEKWFEPSPVEMGIRMRQAFESFKHPDEESLKIANSLRAAAKETVKKFDYRNQANGFLRAIETAYKSWKDNNGEVKPQDFSEFAQKYEDVAAGETANV